MTEALRAASESGLLPAGVLSDRRGHLAGSTGREAPDIELREVLICAPDEPDKTIRLLSNLLDVPAWVLVSSLLGLGVVGLSARRLYAGAQR